MIHFYSWPPPPHNTHSTFTSIRLCPTLKKQNSKQNKKTPNHARQDSKWMQLIAMVGPFPRLHLPFYTGMSTLAVPQRRQAAWPPPSRRLVAALPTFPRSSESRNPTSAREADFRLHAADYTLYAGARSKARAERGRGWGAEPWGGRGGTDHVTRFHCLHAERPERLASVSRWAPFRFHFRWGAASDWP